MTQSESYDVIVVGSGSSGGIVTSRLSEDPSCRVLVLEAGPDFPEEAHQAPPFFVLGATLGKGGAGHGPPSPDLDWGFKSEPMFGRRINLGRGKLVGGSSMVNGCIGVRGRPEDFQRWEAAGAKGWDWDSVLPYYERVDAMQPLQTWERGQWLPLQDVLISGFQELGFRYYEDMNDPGAWDDAVGPWPQNRRNGIRQGTLVTYIRAARARSNFELRSRVLVDKVLLDGTRATGVRYLDSTGQPVEVSASRVVLSGGTYGTPQILLRSGIGPAEELRALGIGPVVDLPVGRNLMEHAYVRLLFTAPADVTKMFGPGMAAVARGKDWYAIPVPIDEEAGICALNFILATTDGDGTIALRSADPAAPPVVQLNLERFADGGFGTAWAAYHDITRTPTVSGRGVRVDAGGLSLTEILHARMATGAHPAGGCRIGEVVDPDLRVIGVDDLYVADASVFPRHVSNNPERTCMMIGEYASAKLAQSTLAAHP